MLDAVRSFFAPPISADLDQGTQKLAWLVRLRWIALLAQVGTIQPALHFGLLEPAKLPAFVAVIGVLATLNVTTWGWLRRGGSATQPHVMFQLAIDAAALSLLLALTGGAWNPLAPILFVHAVLGSLLLEGRTSLYFFGLLIGCLLFIQGFAFIPAGLRGRLVPGEILLPAQMLFAVVFWILTAWLSRTLSAMQGRFSAFRERKTRIDRLRAVGALAAGLSHEFATPLNTAQVKLRRLARVHGLEGDADLATATEALERCGEVLRHMAGSQLRPEGLSLDEIDIDRLVERVCRSFAGANEGASVRFLATGRSPRRALVPAVAFSQAVLNLIDNAVQAGGADGGVEVVVGRRGNTVEVSVLDRGAGWPDVVRRHLGEPFVTTKPHGVGLGLYYVHTLAQALGAELVLEDRSSGGAIARITLPAAEPSAPVAAAPGVEAAEVAT
ncbi:MAG: HAMP domain-containing sensor histidine kinase [Myxococcota bacterium]|nr:HAMP domain-containing histidine kinase [Myxococcales bacterium]